MPMRKVGLALHGVVVAEGIVAACRQQLRKCRLHIIGLIDRAALNHGRLAVPPPWQPEPGQSPGQNRLLQPRLLPAVAVIDRDVDALDLAMPAPGNARYLVEAGLLQFLTARRPGDD